jgi:hypothetical protein
MQPKLLFNAVDAETIRAARRAARREGARFVIGWWNDGVDARRLMLLPEGHRVTVEHPFVPLLRVGPSGLAEPLAA